jgi:hypothetical protein
MQRVADLRHLASAGGQRRPVELPAAMCSASAACGEDVRPADEAANPTN